MYTIYLFGIEAGSYSNLEAAVAASAGNCDAFITDPNGEIVIATEGK